MVTSNTEWACSVCWFSGKLTSISCQFLRKLTLNPLKQNHSFSNCVDFWKNWHDCLLIFTKIDISKLLLNTNIRQHNNKIDLRWIKIKIKILITFDLPIRLKSLRAQNVCIDHSYRWTHTHVTFRENWQNPIRVVFRINWNNPIRVVFCEKWQFTNYRFHY